MDLRSKVLPVLRRLHDVTIGDVTQATGLTATEVGETLWALVAERHGFVDVATGGAVRFRFPPDLDPTRHERWQDFWKMVWRGLKAVYKVGITVILVAYFIIFLVIMIALLIASITGNSSGGSSSSSRIDFPDFLGWLSWGNSSNTSSSSFDRWDRSRSISGRTYRERSLPEKIFAFVFGEEEPPEDPRLADEQAVAYARQHKGLMTSTEMVALRGGRLAEAARDMAHLAYENQGGAIVTDGGTFLYEMQDLVVSAVEEPKDRASEYIERATGGSHKPVVPYCWNRSESLLPFNDNSDWFNVGISLVNGFNLCWSGFFTFAPVRAGPNMWAAHALGPIPFVFSALFFVIPLVRGVWLHVENKRRTERNDWRLMLQRLFEKHVWAKEATPVTVATLSGGATEDRDAWDRRVAKAVEVYHGREVEGGYVFDALRQDVREVEAARQGATSVQARLGAVVLSTEDAPRVSTPRISASA